MRMMQGILDLITEANATLLRFITVYPVAIVVLLLVGQLVEPLTEVF